MNEEFVRRVNQIVYNGTNFITQLKGSIKCERIVTIKSLVALQEMAEFNGEDYEAGAFKQLIAIAESIKEPGGPVLPDL